MVAPWLDKTMSFINKLFRFKEAGGEVKSLRSKYVGLHMRYKVKNN